ncbi:MAG: hypothetical protein ACOZNI_22900 [Myxococcota bacterium]
MRREKVSRVLGMRFEVHEAYTPREATDAIRKAPPDAIVATLRQVEENGLLVAKALRALVGKDCFILVHGPTTSCTTADERRQVLAAHGVDQWAPSVLDGHDLMVVLGSRATLHLVKREPPKTFWQRVRATRWRDVWAFLTKHHHVFPTPPPRADGKPTWLEILNGPPSPQNVRRLMTKSIF